jgi:hypothetical protein
MKMMKVFDCQYMPEDIKKAFFDLTDDYKNDCYVSWFVKDELDDEDNDKALLVTKWLLEEGAEESDEEVLINHWW